MDTLGLGHSQRRSVSLVNIKELKEDDKWKTETKSADNIRNGQAGSVEFAVPVPIIKKVIIDKSWKNVEVHGLEAFKHSTSKLGKAFWLTILVVCSLLLCYEVVAVFINYYTRPLSTSYQIITAESMPLPDITICPMNAINWTTINNNKTYLKYAFYLKQVGSVKDYEGTLDKLGSKTLSFNFTVEDAKEKFMQFGYSREQFMPACGFRQTQTEYVRCSDITEERMDGMYGKCFLLKLGQDKQQSTPGQGLTVIFNLHKKLYPTVQLFAPTVEGVEVRVPGSKVYLRPGSRYTIDLIAEHMQFINVQRGTISYSCVSKDENIYEYKVLHQDFYTQESCMYDCYVYRVWTTCDCLPLIDPARIQRHILNGDSKPILCDAPRYRDCVRPKIDNDSSIIEKVNNCRRKCFQPCDYMRYHLKVSDAPMHPAGLGPLLELGNGTVDEFISMEIAYPQLDFAEFQQDVSKSFHELVADLGGQVGLWLGASMVTLIQIPFLLTTMCLCASYKKANVIKNKVAAGRRFTQACI